MPQLQRHKTKIFDYLESNEANRPLNMILFHGFGADAEDLVGLQGYLKQQKVGRFIYPNGVMPANSLPAGRAWFPIDVSALESAMMTGAYRDFSSPAPPELTKLTQSIEQSIIDELGLSPKNTILAGFSQGAMIASHIMLNSANNYKALAILSGSFLDKENWKNKIKGKQKKAPIFISHGKNDALLNPKDAELLFEEFRTNKYPVDYHPFQGGHEIPLEILSALSKFIDRL